MRHLILFLTFVFFICACGSDKQEAALDELVVILNDEPERLSPILATSLIETEVMEYMFLSLCDFDPVSSDFVPVLTTKVPEGIVSQNESGESITTYSVTILPDAVWSDGSPITGYDFEFTMKLVFTPDIGASSWQQVLADIVEVNVNAASPKEFEVVVKGDYFLAKETFLTTEIYPAHIYDADKLIGAWSYTDFRGEGFFDSLSEDDKAKVKELATQFSDFKYSKTDIIEGAGPYMLEAWETGQYIVLKRKEDYWGKAYEERSFLRAIPRQIIFQFISDPTVAITQVKSGEADVLSLTKASAQAIDDLKSDKTFVDEYEIHYAQQPAIYYIMLNNADKRLNDVNVRKALAHLMDVERLIDQQEGGYGATTNSVIPKSKTYYNNDIAPVKYDVEKAKTILTEAGWSDTDGNGVLDKVIDDRKEELTLRFFISGSQLSKVISSVMANTAKEVGVDIEVITKPGKAALSENVLPGDYELFVSRVTSEGNFDGYVFWHSSSTGINGRNWVNYNNPRADELLTTIRTTKNETERREAYLELQEVMADDQPVIFLYAPVDKIAVSKKYKPLISSKRPGYFANCFEIVE